MSSGGGGRRRERRMVMLVRVVRRRCGGHGCVLHCVVRAKQRRVVLVRGRACASVCDNKD